MSRAEKEWVYGWLAVAVIAASMIFLGFCACSSDAAKRVASTTRVEYGVGNGSLDTGGKRSFDADSEWVALSIEPLAALDPPRHVVLDNPVPASEREASRVEAAPSNGDGRSLAPLPPDKLSPSVGEGSLSTPVKRASFGGILALFGILAVLAVTVYAFWEKVLHLVGWFWGRLGGWLRKAEK